jgi:hypothetical protein
MDEYTIKIILVGILLLIFPVAFALKKRYYPKEYEQEITQFSNIKFFIILITLTAAYQLLDVFNGKTVLTWGELISSGVASAVSLITVIITYKPNLPASAKRFLVGIGFLSIAMLALNIFIYFIQS